MADGAGSDPAAGVTDALRAAIDRTLSVAGQRARAGSAALPVERTTQLLDELARRGRDARDELARRGQRAGAALGGGGGDLEALAGRLDAVERRLAALETSHRISNPELEH